MKNSLKLILTLIWLSSGCAGLRSSTMADLYHPHAPVSENFKNLSEEQRRDIFFKRRLTWDGYSALLGGEARLGNKALSEYLEMSGAPDLAKAAGTASPGILAKESIKWNGEQGSIPGDSLEILRGVQKPEDLAVIGAGVAGAVGAAWAIVSVVQGVWSDLNPNPTLEDVLEAYNQRLAFALGLDFRDVYLITSMPRPHKAIALTGRERMRGQYLVRTGIGSGMTLMGVASAIAVYQWSHGSLAPDWGWGVFGAGAGAILANILLGVTVVW